MPICNIPPAATSSKSATEIDDHASEAAKMKRTREQAYFNSYDFDAIEELPYAEDEHEVSVGNANSKRLQQQQRQRRPQHKQSVGSATMLDLSHASTLNFKTLPIAHSPNSRRRLHHSLLSSAKDQTTPITTASSGSGSSHSSSEHLKYSYLHRLGAFFGHNGVEQPTKTKCGSLGSSSLRDVTEVVVVGGGEQQQHELIAAARSTAAAVEVDNGNFLLPRAMLKYQSSAGNSNSMPLAVIATTHAATSKSLQHASNNNIRSSHGSSNAITTSNTKPCNTSTNLATLRPNQNRKTHLNSNENGTGFQNAMAIAAAAVKSTTLARNKKNAESSTTASTTTTARAPRSVEHIVNENVVEQTTDLTAQQRIGNTKPTKMVKTTATMPPAQSSRSGQRNRVSSHQSHYSTDKSGSSGYYSSNVCSTYSIEDHIYCEPVIDVLDLNSNGNCNGNAKSKSALVSPSNNSNTNNNSKPVGSKLTALGHKVEQSENARASRPKIMNGVGQSERVEADCDDDEDDGEGKDVANTVNQVILRSLQRTPSKPSPATQAPHLNENLRILETSIENLDRHLKAFPSLSSQEHIASFVQVHHNYMPHGEENRRAYQHLPTIMEGYDPAIQQPRAWQDVDIADDSLMDIDLDSFLLVNELAATGNGNRRSAKKLKSKSGPITAAGIDNPSFLAEELEENNYKCAKYINSCPEDAYRVESDIVALGTAAGTGTASQKSASIDHFLKRYEDQIHFQNTRELLEDVRDKIRLLSRSSSESSQRETLAQNAELPTELEGMIKTLKLELETYLSRMNQHSECEIRQLCSGIVKNQHIVKMKKAFERRRSIASLSAIDSEYDFSAYEAIRDGVIVAASGVPMGIRQKITSIRCASDPNFKMKRKSLTEIFPAADFYVENVTDTQCVANYENAIVSASDTSLVNTPITQLQRNLSFHQPILNQLNSKVGPTGIDSRNVLGNNGSGSGSGAESGDKDSIMEWHRKKPSIWEMYYGTNRMSQSLLGKRGMIVNTNQAAMSYPSSRPESDFTLDLPRAEQLRIKMDKEKKFRQRCRYITSFLSLVFFLLTVMVVSLVLTRGKRMFGSMI